MMVQRQCSRWILGLTCFVFLFCALMIGPMQASAGTIVKKKPVAKRANSRKWQAYKKKKKAIVLGNVMVGGKHQIPQRFYFHRTNYKRMQGKLKLKGLLQKVVGTVKKGLF